MRVCLGGTFHPLHAGHEALLRSACANATKVFIGITDGELATRADRDIAPWEERADAVAHAVAAIGYTGDLEINHLVDANGPAATGDYDVIIVSPETVAGAERINQERESAGLTPLQIRAISHALADDLLPISSTRIHAGVIDRDGRRLGPIRVIVGSANPLKIDGVKVAVERMFSDLDVHVEGVAVESGVPEQPRLREIMDGATARARAAMQIRPESDYAIGVEAGLSQDEDERWFDVQACCIVDGDGRETTGYGPAFGYPEWVTRRALDGDMVSDILGPVANDERIGGTTGAIGFLTDGRYMRNEFTAQAVLMAFVPRVRRELYDGEPT